MNRILYLLLAGIIFENAAFADQSASFEKLIIKQSIFLGQNKNLAEFFESYYFERLESSQKKKCWDYLLKLNSDLQMHESAQPTTVIYLPPSDYCQTSTRALASEHIEEDQMDEEADAFKPAAKKIFQLGLANKYSFLRGTRKGNGAEVELVTERHISFDASLSFKTKAWTLSSGIEIESLSFQSPTSTMILNDQETLTTVYVSISKKFFDTFLVTFSQRMGEELFHSANLGQLELFKFQSITPELTLAWNFYQTKSIDLSLVGTSGHAFVTTDQNGLLSGGFNRRLQFQVKFSEDGLYYQTYLFHESRSFESSDLEQSLSGQGLGLRIGWEF